MFFLGHNFVSRHVRRSSKVSIDAGDHLVSTTSLRKILTIEIGLQDPSNLVKKQQYPTL